MMGGRTPETSCAVNKRQDNKLKNCCIWLVIYLNCTMMYGLTILKKSTQRRWLQMVISILRSSEMWRYVPGQGATDRNPLLNRCAHFKTTKCLKPYLLEDAGRSTLVVRQSKKTVWTLKMGPICCPETSVTV